MDLFNKLTIGMMSVVPKPIVGRIASKYIAGAKLSDAVRAIKSLQSQGAIATLDLLGELCDDPDRVREATQTYLKMLDVIEEEKLDSNVSVKPTQLGLKIGYDFCKEQIISIVKRAAGKNNYVRIDMEDHTCTDDTIRLYREIHDQYENVGVVLQAYLHRTINDIQPLMEMKANIRICKGIYVEPRRICYKNRTIVINNFALLVEELLKAGCYVGIATHCDEVIWHAKRIIYQLGLKRDQYEFQMLLGVQEELRQILIDEGHKLRVYVPFGEEWYPYSTRRLKENPSIAGYVMKDFLKINRQDGKR